MRSLRTLQEELRFKNEKYLRAHPELSSILRDFARAAFQAKPASHEVVGFAADYFARRKAHYGPAGGAAAGGKDSGAPS